MKIQPLILTALLSSLLAAGCSHEAKRAEISVATLQARTMAVSEQQVPRIIAVRGTIQAEDDAVLSSRATGPVVRERVRVGDRVRKGDALLEIEERMNSGMLAQAQGALAQAQAARTLAETNLHRFEALVAAQACSQLEFEMARMQFETADGALKQAQGAVDAAGAVADESTIRAPFDGIVAEKFVSVGDLVAPGRPLLRLQAAGARDLQFSVRAADATYLSVGMKIECKLDGDEQPVQATITEFSAAADPLTHSVPVRARLLAADSLDVGFTATAEIPAELVEAMLVPASSIYTTGGVSLATIVDEENRATTRAVTLGRRRGDNIEILSGLKRGEIVVLDRKGLIPEGTRIERIAG